MKKRVVTVLSGMLMLILVLVTGVMECEASQINGTGNQSTQGDVASDAFGYITSKKTTINCDLVTYIVDEGVYVRNDTVELTNQLCEIVQNVMGMRLKKNVKFFIHNKPYNYRYAEVGAHFCGGSWMFGCDESMNGYIDMMITEIADNILRQNSTYVYKVGTNVLYGIEHYITYKTLACLELFQISELNWMYEAQEYLYRMALPEQDYAIMYSKPLEYWVDHEIKEYTIDATWLYFMMYLDNNFGGCTAWLPNVGSSSKDLTPNEIMGIFDRTYGAGVADSFYLWVEQNRALFTRSFVWDESDDKSYLVQTLLRDFCQLCDTTRDMGGYFGNDEYVRFYNRNSGMMIGDKHWTDFVLERLRPHFPNVVCLYGYADEAYFFYDGYDRGVYNATKNHFRFEEEYFPTDYWYYATGI